MPADAPTILAASGGIRDGRRTRWEYSALTDYAIELSGVTSREPRVCLVWRPRWATTPSRCTSCMRLRRREARGRHI